ncbi:MAG TPA: CheB methylesterase domain-containing protein [Bacillales bacterium]|nr:CheB methylesterase domain-containing protein [Bacillales bacterium]
MNTFRSIVCIGTSTGGPGALVKVLSKLPKDFPAPLFIVQHMPPKITKSLAERLDSLSFIRVKEAEHREHAEKGTAYIAPGGFHMVLASHSQGIIIELDDSKRKGVHCPSVNELFETASRLKNYSKIAVIMTGMGSDGTEGLQMMKRNGDTFAIAESEATSIVYGMPRAAAATGEVDKVLDLDNIAEGILTKIASIERG